MASLINQKQQLEIDFSTFANFSEASRAALGYLKDRLGFDLWMVTQTDSPHWIMLETSDNSYDVRRGNVFKWQDSFCSRMVEGKGPQVALDVDEVPEYLEAEIGKQVPIGAYLGVPMYGDDGLLQGTLCAIDPAPQSFDVEKEFPQIQLFARFLSSMYSSELRAIENEKEIDRVSKRVGHDALTGLLNRFGWDEAVRREQKRFDRYKQELTFFVLDLDNLKVVNDSQGHHKGDQLIIDTARSISSSVRASDVVARLGGDEFAIMAVGCGAEYSDIILDKLRKYLFDKGILISIGQSYINPQESLEGAIERADRDMLEVKQWKKTQKSLFN